MKKSTDHCHSEVDEDKTLALLLPGSGAAALIFDGRLDYFAMAALPLLRRLLEASLFGRCFVISNAAPARP